MASFSAFGVPWTSWIGTLIAALVAVVIVAVLVIVVRFVAGRTHGRSAWIADLERRIRLPGMTLAFIIAGWIVCAATGPAFLPWWPVLDRLLLIATVLAGAWLLSVLVTFGMERLMQYDSRRDHTSPGARRRQTQLTVLNRLAVVLISVIAVGIVLFSFPEVRAVGTSILASAGVVSIVAGLAAQSTLGNLIAGPAGPVLCDLDSLCAGPPEWDLTPMAVGRLRLGHPPERYQQLVEAYGFDVTEWSGFAVLRDLRELKITTSVLPILRSNPRIRGELRRRLDSLRRRDDGERWTAYH